jgi:hypothetical protein
MIRKTAIILLFLSILLKMMAQGYEVDSMQMKYFEIQKQPNKFKSKYLPIILFTTSIALNAVGDGLNDSDKKMAGHICNSLSIASLIAIPLSCDINKRKWPVYLMSYVTLRVGLFDPIYNSTRRLPFNYVGQSKCNR